MEEEVAEIGTKTGDSDSFLMNWKAVPSSLIVFMYSSNTTPLFCFIISPNILKYCFWHAGDVNLIKKFYFDKLCMILFSVILLISSSICSALYKYFLFYMLSIKSKNHFVLDKDLKTIFFFSNNLHRFYQLNIGNPPSLCSLIRIARLLQLFRLHPESKFWVGIKKLLSSWRSK